MCMEAVTGLTDHCGNTAVEHVKTILEWLSDLLLDSLSSHTKWDDLEICEPEFIFKQLSSPHGRVDQGFLMSGWRAA